MIDLHAMAEKERIRMAAATTWKERSAAEKALKHLTMRILQEEIEERRTQAHISYEVSRNA